MKTYKILILEDDFEAVSKIMAELYDLEELFSPFDFDITTLSTYEAVEKLINPQESDAYDVILLDRDCKIGGSFHILDMEKFGVHKIISISSTPQWNEEAKARGVKRVVHKNFGNLEGFAKKVSSEVESLLKKNHLEPKKMPSLTSFLRGSGPDYSGRYIRQVLEMNDQELEEIHNYIQWLFPLNEFNNTVPNSPILTNRDISVAKKDKAIQSNLMSAMARMEQFYNDNDHWIEEYNHNHLRITRIIKSLNAMLGYQIAEEFYFKIMARINTKPGVVNDESITYWKNAL